jgi:lysophospholipase L1-like esterase
MGQSAIPGLILNDVESLFLDTVQKGAPLAELLLPDQLHLSEKGHDLYFKSIYPLVEQAVSELIGVNAHLSL